jgi:hypothetical protein
MALRNIKRDSALARLGAKCEEVFVKSKGGYKYSPKRNAFDAALLIRRKSLSTPMATCQLSQVTRKGDLLDVALQCANAISYSPVKAYFRLAADGGITRLVTPEDTGGDKYEKCLP